MLSQTLIQWVFCIGFLVVCTFAQEELSTSTSAAHKSAINGWKVASSVRDLSDDFFFALKENQPVAGDYFFALVSHHKGRENPSFIGGKVEANAPIMESSSFTSTEYLRLSFRGESDVLISDGNSQLYWVVDASTRSITYGPVESAARFKMFVNEKDPSILFLKTGDFFVSIIAGEVSLSPLLVDRSFFYTRTSSTGKSSKEFRTHLESMILQLRREALSAGGDLTTTWIAYELALALPLGRDLNKFAMSRVIDIDLALLFDKTFELITSDLLKEDYKKYPTYGKDLPKDFQLYTLTNNFQVESLPGRADDANGKKPWHSFSNLLPHVATFPKRSELQTLFQTMILNDAIIQDKELDTQRFAYPDLNPLLLNYFMSSCQLAEKFGTTLSLVDKIENTAFPSYASNHKVENPVTKEIAGTIETYWFSSLLVPEIKAIDDQLPRKLFYELALLKHLQPAWVSVHSSIGESVAQYFLKTLQQSMKEFDVEKVVQFFSNVFVNEVLTAAGRYCTQESRISFCILPQTLYVAQTFGGYIQGNQDPNTIMDLREVVDLNGQEYNLLIKKELQKGQLLEDLNQAKDEMITLTAEMGNDLLEKINDASLTSLVETTNQVKENSFALYERLTETVGYQMGIQKSLAERKMKIIEDRYARARAVKDEYLATLKKLVSTALSETITESFFAFASTIVSFGDAMQSVVKPVEHPNPLGFLGVTNKAMNFGISLSKMTSTLALKKQLESLVPGLMDMAKQFEDHLPKVQALREVALPLVDSTGQVDDVKLSNQTRAFNQVFDKTPRLTMSLVMRTADQVFDLIAGHLCVYISRVSFPPCVKIFGLNGEFFGNLREGMDASNEVLSLLGAMSSYATDILAAKDFHQTLNEGFNLSASDIATLKQEWGTDEKARQLWVFKYRKQANLGNSINTFYTLQAQTNYLMSLYTLCNSLAYSNGGVPPSECVEQVYKYKRVEPITLNALLAFQGSTKPNVEQMEAMIPTAPQFLNDTGYIDLPRLLDGQPVSFQLSRDFETLRSLGWVTSERDLEDSVIFLKKFTLILPPRYVDFEEEVAIEIETQGITDLGPGLEKRGLKRYFRLPSTQFKVEYGNTGMCQDDTEVDSPYATCTSKIRPVCIQSPGDTNVVDRGLNVGLFSELKLTATINNPNNAGLFAYRSMATPMFLQVKAETLVNPLDDERRRRRNLRRQAAVVPVQNRRRTAEGSKTCCSKDHYALDWSEEGTCERCPEGTVFQLGGLFCVAHPTKTDGNTTTTLAPTEEPSS